MSYLFNSYVESYIGFFHHTSNSIFKFYQLSFEIWQLNLIYSGSNNICCNLCTIFLSNYFAQIVFNIIF